MSRVRLVSVGVHYSVVHRGCNDVGCERRWSVDK